VIHAQPSAKLGEKFLQMMEFLDTSADGWNGFRGVSHLFSPLPLNP
jgi:hypothetical protein